MEKLEHVVSKKLRRTKVQQAILATIAIAGIISITAVAPNALQLLAPFVRKGKKPWNRKYSTNTAFWRLVDRGYVALEEKGGRKVARLTSKGEQALAPLNRPGVALRRPKKWDGKWRVLIFDIKETRRSTRDQLREMLQRIGFISLQRSVWVYPYDCEDLIILLKTDFKIGKEVLYIIADQIENDAALRIFFTLPRSKS